MPTSNEQEVEDKADKRVQQLEDHRLGEVEGDQQTHWRHAFTAIRINFKIGWAGQHDRDAVAEALDQAINKYCSVDATLSHGARIEFRKTDA